MKMIEEEANAQIGTENAKRVLLPFTSILNPILKILNINVQKGNQSKSSNSSKDRQEYASIMTGWATNTNNPNGSTINDEIGIGAE